MTGGVVWRRSRFSIPEDFSSHSGLFRSHGGTDTHLYQEELVSKRLVAQKTAAVAGDVAFFGLLKDPARRLPGLHAWLAVHGSRPPAAPQPISSPAWQLRRVEESCLVLATSFGLAPAPMAIHVRCPPDISSSDSIRF